MDAKLKAVICSLLLLGLTGLRLKFGEVEQCSSRYGRRLSWCSGWVSRSTAGGQGNTEYLTYYSVQ